ncbi:MAG: hypothetical protein MHM6MM_007067 [Cercozoa sp. M6MM]
MGSTEAALKSLVERKAAQGRTTARTIAQGGGAAVRRARLAAKIQAKKAAVPKFREVSAAEDEEASQQRSLPIPQHRFSALKKHWLSLFETCVQQLLVQVRVDPKKKLVEFRTSEHTKDRNAVNRAHDFVRAFLLGFELRDAMAMVRLEDMRLDSFEVTDVKLLQGDHLSRAIGRIAGQGGKTKFAIENATRTRIVLQEQKVHILGSVSNVKIARDAVCRLIIGAPPGKVYSQMRMVASKMKHRY